MVVFKTEKVGQFKLRNPFPNKHILGASLTKTICISSVSLESEKVN